MRGLGARVDSYSDPQVCSAVYTPGLVSTTVRRLTVVSVGRRTQPGKRDRRRAWGGWAGAISFYGVGADKGLSFLSQVALSLFPSLFRFDALTTVLVTRRSPLDAERCPLLRKNQQNATTLSATRTE